MFKNNILSERHFIYYYYYNTNLKPWCNNAGYYSLAVRPICQHSCIRRSSKGSRTVYHSIIMVSTASFIYYIYTLSSPTLTGQHIKVVTPLFISLKLFIFKWTVYYNCYVFISLKVSIKVNCLLESLKFPIFYWTLH